MIMYKLVVKSCANYPKLNQIKYAEQLDPSFKGSIPYARCLVSGTFLLHPKRLRKQQKHVKENMPPGMLLPNLNKVVSVYDV